MLKIQKKYILFIDYMIMNVKENYRLITNDSWISMLKFQLQYLSSKYSNVNIQNFDNQVSFPFTKIILLNCSIFFYTKIMSKIWILKNLVFQFLQPSK